MIEKESIESVLKKINDINLKEVEDIAAIKVKARHDRWAALDELKDQIFGIIMSSEVSHIIIEIYTDKLDDDNQYRYITSERKLIGPVNVNTISLDGDGKTLPEIRISGNFKISLDRVYNIMTFPSREAAELYLEVNNHEI